MTETLRILPSKGFDYINTGNPTASTNPPVALVTWLNATSGSLFTCIDNTTDANVWAEYVLNSSVREVLTANRTYYVRTDGSDSNDGLANSAGGAFLTIQKAIDTVYSLDGSTYDVTISVGSGTYTGEVLISGMRVGSGTFSLLGDTTTPSNCILAYTGAYGVRVDKMANVDIQGFQVQSYSSYAIGVTFYATASISNVTFNGSGSHIFASGFGRISVGAGITISASAARHIFAVSNSSVNYATGQTVTLTGTPAFSTAFVESRECSVTTSSSTTF